MLLFAEGSFSQRWFHISLSLGVLSVFLFYFASFISVFLSVLFCFSEVWTNRCVAASNVDATVLIFQCLDDASFVRVSTEPGESVLFIFLG